MSTDLALRTLKEKLESLKREREKKIQEITDKYNSDISDLSHAISLLDTRSSITKPIAAPYPATGEWQDRISYVLKDKKRFLHNRELAAYLREIDANLRAMDIDHLVARLSARLSNLKSKHILVCVEVFGSNRNRFYGFSEWMKDSKIISEFNFNPDYLTDRLNEEYYTNYKLIA